MQAATGEDVTPEELGGGELHTTTSGVADHLAGMRMAWNPLANARDTTLQTHSRHLTSQVLQAIMTALQQQAITVRDAG